jgi:hypothetical protein
MFAKIVAGSAWSTATATAATGSRLGADLEPTLNPAERNAKIDTTH